MEPPVFPFCEKGDFFCITGRERKGVLGPPPTVGGQNREKQKTLQYSLVWNGLEVGCGGAGCGVWGVCVGGCCTRARKVLG